MDTAAGRTDRGGGGSLCDAEPRRQGRQSAGGRIAAGAARREQHGQEHGEPRLGWALAHAKPAPLHHLEALRLQVRAQEEEPVFRRRQGAVLVHATLTRRPGWPIEPPRRQGGVARRLTGRDRLLECVERQAGEIQDLRGAGLHVGTLSTGHAWRLLSWEAP